MYYRDAERKDCQWLSDLATSPGCGSNFHFYHGIRSKPGNLLVPWIIMGTVKWMWHLDVQVMDILVSYRKHVHSQ